MASQAHPTHRTTRASGAAAPSRVVVAAVEPDVDRGRFAVKRVVGETVLVRAVAFTDGHDHLAAELRVRHAARPEWKSVPLAAAGNDRWEGAFVPDALGRWELVVEAWIDRFATWRWGLARKVSAAQDVGADLAMGAELVRAAGRRAGGGDGDWLAERARELVGSGDAAVRAERGLDPELARRMAVHGDRAGSAMLDHVVPFEVERERAAFGAWYECFPRSASPVPGRHGTFRDLIGRLPYVAAMGFDVLYLPPIHPIGRTHRKGRDNALAAAPDDVGSPWAIGGPEGGHTAVHPALGTLEDFDALVAAARDAGLELALDVAFQCAPDHPWVDEHPEWFRRRPDGSIQYAENPPKRYQDIYPFDFEGAAWRALWDALRDVVLFWCARGVRVFRVDNPHTKPFAFWQWMIAEVRARHPDAVFLAEAFTRPAVLQHLAKVGFSQSYTYFTWRNTKDELTAFASELDAPPVSDFLRPNLFVNTPDILHEYLQAGGRAAFQCRLVLAATLAGTYGVYGPPFELAVGDAVPGTEEYLGSEKYEVRHWDLDVPWSLRDLVARVNAIRRDNAAFRAVGRLRFLAVDNPMLIAYARSTPDGANLLVMVVNLDPHHAQSGWMDLPAELGSAEPFQVDDLLGGARYLWQGARSFVALDPQALPAHVFRVRRRVRTERDFDYWL